MVLKIKIRNFEPMKELVFLLLVIPFFVSAQNQPTDSVNTLDEITLIEDFISKKAIGITESSSVGISE